MSIPSIPRDVKNIILNFIEPENFSDGAVRNCGRDISNLSSVSKEFKGICKEKLETLKKMDALIKKYPKYNAEYNHFVKDKTSCGNPLLLDALFTGCKLLYADHTFKKYTQELEEDIKKIIKLMPQSIHCNIGIIRCRNGVPPLAAACHNDKMPIHMIEFLLENGADPNQTYDLNGMQISILADLKICLEPNRFEAIEALFKKFGGVVSEPLFKPWKNSKTMAQN